MGGDLVRLNYASTATFEPNEAGGIEVEVARILAESRRNNKAREVGGVLHYGNGFFFQALEGERGVVNDVYNTIAADPRHRDVQILSFNPVEQRLFADWSMKYVPIENQIRELLDRHGIEFNPYRFDDAFIREFLELCVYGQDPTTRLEQEAERDAAEGRDQRPWWKRLLGL